MNNLLSQGTGGVQVGTETDGLRLSPEGGFKGFGKLGLQGDSSASNASGTFSNFISSVIGILTIIAFIWFIFLFITGAISYMSAGGDKTAIESARKRIVNGLVGLVIVIAAIFIIRLVGYLIGIPDILNFVSLFSILTGTNVQ
jgi:hypothetical protein